MLTPLEIWFQAKTHRCESKPKPTTSKWPHYLEEAASEGPCGHLRLSAEVLDWIDFKVLSTENPTTLSALWPSLVATLPIFPDPEGGWLTLATSPRVGTPTLPSPRTRLLLDAPPGSGQVATPCGQCMCSDRPRCRDRGILPCRPPFRCPPATRLLTVQVADLAVLDCWKVTSKWWGPG